MRRSIIAVSVLLMAPARVSGCFDHDATPTPGWFWKGAAHHWEFRQERAGANRWEEGLDVTVVAAGCAGVGLIGLSLVVFSRATKLSRAARIGSVTPVPLVLPSDRPIRVDPAHEGGGAGRAQHTVGAAVPARLDASSASRSV